MAEKQILSAPYFLVVEGKRGPKVPLADLDAARAQAQCLHARNEGRKRVFILATIDMVEADAPPPEHTLRLPKRENQRG